MDSQKIETALQNAPCKGAQCQTRAPCRFFRFQDRAGFIKCVKTICQLEQIICEKNFGGITKGEFVDLRHGVADFSKNGTNPHKSVLQIWRRVSLEGEHALP